MEVTEKSEVREYWERDIVVAFLMVRCRFGGEGRGEAEGGREVEGSGAE